MRSSSPDFNLNDEGPVPVLDIHAEGTPAEAAWLAVTKHVKTKFGADTEEGKKEFRELMDMMGLLPTATTNSGCCKMCGKELPLAVTRSRNTARYAPGYCSVCTKIVRKSQS